MTMCGGSHLAQLAQDARRSELIGQAEAADTVRRRNVLATLARGRDRIDAREADKRRILRPAAVDPVEDRLPGAPLGI
jgi:hypothetical protein